MKRMITMLAILSMVGCVRIHLPLGPDGKVDTQKVLSWIADGVAMDCAIQGADAPVCEIGLPAIREAQQNNPTNLKAFLLALNAKVPALAAWDSWALNDL